MEIDKLSDKEKAQIIWNEYIWLMYGSDCLFCKSGENVDIMRIIPEKHISTLFDTRNGLPLCRHCRNLSIHKPDEFLDKLVECLTQEVLEDLMEKAQVKKRKINYGLTINKLRENINGIKN